MKSFIQFNPVRTLAAAAVLLHSVIALVAFTQTWDGELVILVNGVATAFVALFGTLFVESKATANAALQALADAEKALDNPA